MPEPLLTTDLPFPVRRGKVRDVYDLSAVEPGRLLIVATDRISAYDCVMPNGIPDKGRLLTGLSAFWFDRYGGGVPHHVVSTDVADYPPQLTPHAPLLAGRSMLVRQTSVIPIECVARGYLAGSGWKEYQQNGCVCGIPLPPGLVECDKLPEPIFTPATKADSGHDLNVTFEQTVELIGRGLAEHLRRTTLDLYARAADYAAGRGVIIADTKFEFGRLRAGTGRTGTGRTGAGRTGRTGSLSKHDASGLTGVGVGDDGQGTPDETPLGDEVILIDEILTPDSSRFWPAGAYRPGQDQPSFDKQFVRNWLSTQPWDKSPPAPPLPAAVVAGTRARYVEAYELLTGRRFGGESVQR